LKGKTLVEEKVRSTLKAKYPNMPESLLSVGLSEIFSHERLNYTASKFGFQHVVMPEQKVSLIFMFIVEGLWRLRVQFSRRYRERTWNEKN
jgi:hypothetical protein